MAKTVPLRGPKMNARRRKSLKSSQFGLPGQKKYPLDSRRRAANAKGRAKQQLNKGKLSQSSYSQVVSRANKVLGTKKRKRRKKS